MFRFKGREHKKRQSARDEGEASIWSTGLVFVTLILLTALMFALAKKVVGEGQPSSDASVMDIRARR